MYYFLRQLNTSTPVPIAHMEPKSKALHRAEVGLGAATGVDSAFRIERTLPLGLVSP